MAKTKKILGTIDNVKLYPRALTSRQVKAHFQGKRIGVKPYSREQIKKFRGKYLVSTQDGFTGEPGTVRTVEGMRVLPIEYRFPQAQCAAGRQLHHLSKALTEETQSRENLMKIGVSLKALGDALIRLGVWP